MNKKFRVIFTLTESPIGKTVEAENKQDAIEKVIDIIRKSIFATEN